MKLATITLFLLAVLTGYAQQLPPQNSKMPIPEFQQLVARCAPGVAVETMVAIAQTESSFHVAAISLNRPVAAARRAGWMNHRIELLRQPKSREEAIRWMHWFADRHYSVSVGLMQVNIENAGRFGLRPEQLFDTCTNVAVGGAILGTIYAQAIHEHKTSNDALLDSISIYNSGSQNTGYANGYVSTVVKNATQQTYNTLSSSGSRAK
jgi:type IV secretion system protein VirB1